MRPKLMSIKMLLLAASLVLTSGIGAVYAVNLDAEQPETTTPVVSETDKDKEKGKTETTNRPSQPEQKDKIKVMSKEDKKKLDEMLAKENPPVDVKLSDDEKIELYKLGFSFEEIDLAVDLAKDLKRKDVKALLQEKKDGIKALKDKRQRVESPSEMPDMKVVQELVAAGHSEDDVFFAYSVAKQLNVSLEEALEGITSGDPVFAEKMRQKGGAANNAK